MLLLEKVYVQDYTSNGIIRVGIIPVVCDVESEPPKNVDGAEAGKLSAVGGDGGSIWVMPEY